MNNSNSSSNTLPPACKDCKHFNARAHGGVGTLPICNSPASELVRFRYNAVLGVSKDLDCYTARATLCGFEGKFWEPKEVGEFRG